MPPRRARPPVFLAVLAALLSPAAVSSASAAAAHTDAHASAQQASPGYVELLDETYDREPPLYADETGEFSYEWSSPKVAPGERFFVVERAINEGTWLTVHRTDVSEAAHYDYDLVTVEAEEGAKISFRARLTAATSTKGEHLEAVETPVLAFTFFNRPRVYGSTVTMDEPNLSKTTVGSKQAVVSGVVTDTAEQPAVTFPRAVTLSLLTERGPVSMGTARTDRTGAWSGKVPTYWAYKGDIVATVSEDKVVRPDPGPYDSDHDFLSAATSIEAHPMTVRRTYKPQGSKAWNPMIGTKSEPWRYNPCKTIGYRVRTGPGPKNALKLTHKAFKIVSAATGLRFVYEGKTKKHAFSGQGYDQGLDSRTDITFSWTTDKKVPALRGPLGLGGSSGSEGVLRRGGVAIKGTAKLQNGFKRGPTWGSLLLHEIGHVVGLDHVEDRDLVMHAGLGDHSWGQFGRGDLVGLQRVGALNGCAVDKRRSAREVPLEIVPRP